MAADDLKPAYTLREFAHLTQEPFRVVRGRAQRGTLATIKRQGKRYVLLAHLQDHEPALWESIVLAMQLRAKFGRAVRPYYTLPVYAAMTDIRLMTLYQRIKRGTFTTLQVGGRHVVPLVYLRDHDPEGWASVLRVLEARHAHGRHRT